MSCPLLFIHGWWGGPWVWQNYQAFFAHRGYPCHRLDLRACSPPSPQGQVSFYTHLEAVRVAVRQLDCPILIGHSAGGLLATKIAETESVAAVVALAPALPRGMSALNIKLLRVMPRYLWPLLTQRSWIFNRADMSKVNLNCLPAKEQHQIYAQMVPIDPLNIWDIVLRGIPIQVEQLRVPQLIVAGTEDVLTPARALAATARYYGADFYAYPDHGHYLTYEPGWEKIAADILQWIQAKLAPSTSDRTMRDQAMSDQGQGSGS